MYCKVVRGTPRKVRVQTLEHTHPWIQTAQEHTGDQYPLNTGTFYAKDSITLWVVRQKRQTYLGEQRPDEKVSVNQHHPYKSNFPVQSVQNRPEAYQSKSLPISNILLS